jgi:hypothetical protein
MDSLITAAARALASVPVMAAVEVNFGSCKE